MKRIYKLTAALLSCAMLAGAAGCTQYESGNEKVYTYEEAIKELNAFNDQIHTDTIKPRLDIYNSETAAKTLADIKTFPLTVEGSGSIDRNAFGIGTGESAAGLAGSVALSFAFDAVGRRP